MTTYTTLSSESVDGFVESSLQGLLIGSMSSMPVANASYENCIVLYTGATGTYTNSRFYQCKNNGGTYSWELLTVADTQSLSGYVPTSRKINNKALTSDITLSASDVSAVPTSRKINNKQLNADVTLSASDVSAVPTTREVNNKALSSDITLSASDVSAIDSSYLSTAKPISTSTDTQVPTSKAVYTAVNEVAGAVTSEATTRSNADQALQTQIDAIVASSDVKDIVGTKAQLNSYDTSKLGNNDIVKVLTDESQDNKTTYYRWVITGGTGSWTLIGSEGPYVTIATASSTYVPKTTKVNNKALSSDVTLSASDVSAIPSSYLSTAKPVSASTDTQVPTAKAVYAGLNEKMNAMTVDDSPTSGSNNLVKSGGVYTAINDVSTAVSGKQSTITTDAIILEVASWDANDEIVANVTGVTANSIVWVSPAPASWEAYATAGVRCIAQGSGTLTFKCSETPTDAITVNVAIAN